MICFKGCKAEIDKLTNECHEKDLYLAGANGVIRELGDTVTNLTCKYKAEKLALLQQIDDLVELSKEVAIANQEKIELLEKACTDLEDTLATYTCNNDPKSEATAVYLASFKPANQTAEDNADWITTSSATDKPIMTHYYGDDCDSHSPSIQNQLNEVNEVPAKRPYKKHVAHLRKEKNRL